MDSTELTSDVPADDHTQPWIELDHAIEAGDVDSLVGFIENWSAGEAARAVSRLSEKAGRQLFELLPDSYAADLIDEIPDAQALPLLHDVPVEDIAAIADFLPSDEQADLINLFDPEMAREILAEMEPLESADARQLRHYPGDSAGGRMVTEILTCTLSETIGQVIRRFREGLENFDDYDVQYLYVVSDDETLVGVLPLRKLLLARDEQLAGDLMIPHPLSLTVETKFEKLDQFFQDHNFIGVPITTDDGKLVGVVRRSDVDEARRERSDAKFRRISGLIGGEEFRSLPLITRASRRMVWLGLTMVLNLISASIIGFYQNTLDQVIALAMFLPVISGLGGSSGNQAIAVSIRELSLGLVKPYEVKWVLMKELAVGVINGSILGVAIGVAAWVYQGNFYLGLVVGIAMALSNVIAVLLGGGLPLLLKRFRVDAALVAGPVLMTLADASGFFFALSLATFLLEYLK